ncbi:MAG: hypothetical protein E6G84_01940 [Alphaproteobacteria bacterium]|nr:MAG: hypothetical protein E6G84_01940 [Alphaproteobacteria bacterium]
MRYRVYSGPRGSESASPLEKDRWLFKEYAALDDALGWAQHVHDHGGVALLIEGDDGTILTAPSGSLRSRSCRGSALDRCAGACTAPHARGCTPWPAPAHIFPCHSWA